jgi:GGDEF domain-containing protein
MVPTEADRHQFNSPELQREADAYFHAGVVAGKMLVRNESQQSEINHLRHEVSHDGLTGLLRKEAFIDDINERIARNEDFGVMFVDLDAFKAVNDLLGHGTGDEVLRSLGEFLRSKYRRTDDTLTLLEPEAPKNHSDDMSTGRYGGDEIVFAVNLSDNQRRGQYKTPEERMEAEMTYLSSIMQEFVDAQDPRIKNTNFNASIGGYVCRAGFTGDAKDVIELADAAMYEQKRLRKETRG